MLSLKVTAPEYLVIKLVIVLFQNFYSLCIGNMGKFGIEDSVETV